jgi:ribosomal 50S subunit-associated protein YjgA (DUF615 family)
MSKISRSEYQRVCEENKRLLRDLETLTQEGLSAEKILLTHKWREHFENQRNKNNWIRELVLIAQTYGKTENV